ncbi:MAG: DUF6240 domain-containing protein [Lachnospiraceae bacterium]|nr:DUF6240 domain-containing protein [Lachnospiraceae bacterium]
MNITFHELDRMSGNTFARTAGQTTTEYGASVKSTDQRGISLDISSDVTDNKAYKGHGKTAEEVMMNAGLTDLEVQRDYMTVMSNCMSDEDFAKMQQEGFDPGSTEIKDTVTILDHIKTAMMRGGTEVRGFTDTISEEALASITGSEAFAKELQTQFHAKDIPVTEETASEVAGAYERLQSIGPLSDAAAKYLVENDLDPSVDHLYTAAYSAGYDADRQGKGYYAAGGVEGYYAKKPETVDVDALSTQINGIIREAGYEVSEETVKDAAFLVEKGVPLTKDSFGRFEDIRSVKLPMEFPEFVDKATDALLDGIPVSKADLSRESSFRQEALRIYDEVQSEGTIRGRRVLEEVRVSMTVEANLRLLRSGFSIDTAPMEELIRNLKEIEKEFAINLMHDGNEIDAVRKNDIFADTLSAVDNIRTAPIGLSYSFRYEESLLTVSETAAGMKASFEKASLSYETLMTAPRADMGDSIRKAFRNVDELILENNEALTEENRRAVRILGYNGIEITPENIGSVREKDSLLTRTIENLTPGRVLGMIRNNVNPLTMPMEELDRYLREQDTTKEDLLSYSRFLYKLEQDRDITEDEREAYIGIYRLVRQIEKADFAPVGAIDEMNAAFNFENILSALRSRKHKPMDYRVDDSFGGMSAVDKGIASITSQIAKGFVADTSDLRSLLDDTGNREAERQNEQREFEEIRESFRVEEEVLRELQEMKTPVTANNLSDMQQMMNAPSKFFKDLRESGYRKKTGIRLDSQKEAKDSYREFTKDVQEFLKDRAFGEDPGSPLLRSTDIRRISAVYRHAGFLEGQAQEENYSIPATIGTELVAINLKVIHKEGEIPNAAVTFTSEAYGSVAASFRITEEGVDGILNLESRQGVDLLKQREDEFREGLRKEGIACHRMDVVFSKRVDLKDFRIREESDTEPGSGNASADELYRAAKVLLDYITGSRADS